MVILINSYNRRILAREFEKDTDSNLGKLLKSIHNIIKNTDVEFVDYQSKEKVNSALAKTLEKGNHPKYEKVDAMAEFFSTPENTRLLLDMLPKDVSNLMESIYRNGFLPLSEIQEKVRNLVCLVEPNRYSTKITFNDSLYEAFFVIKNTSYYNFDTDDILFCLTPLGLFFHNQIIDHSGSYNYNVTNEEVISKKLLIFNAEADIMQGMHILKKLQEDGEFTTDDRFKTSPSKMRNAAVKAGMKSFFPDKYSFNEYTLALPVLCFAQKIYSTKKTEQLVRYASNIFIDDQPYHFIRHFLPFISGFNSHTMHYGVGDIFFLVNEKLKATKEDQWVDLNLFTIKVRNDNPESYRISFLTDFYRIVESKYLNKLTGKEIETKDFVWRINDLLIRSICCYLVGLGILEVAYEPFEENKTETPLDSMKYVRVTPLGRYAYEQSKTYDAPKIKTEKKFEIDTEHLIIRDIVEKNPYTNMLLDIAQPIGNRRYSINSSSFLKNCKNKTDVKNKISFFKEFVSNEVPPIWNDFFQEMLFRCSPLTQFAKETFEIYQLDKNNKHLIDLMVKDPVLREIIIRADGYKILIERKYLKKFTTRLKDFGYLID